MIANSYLSSTLVLLLCGILLVPPIWYLFPGRFSFNFKNDCPVLTRQRNFTDDPRYLHVTNISDPYWRDLTEPNSGFIWQHDGESEQAQVRGVGMFHQLHCLQEIRSMTIKLLAQKTTPTVPDTIHLIHCLDYLRQTVLCYADDTIEVPKISPEGELMVDGLVPHTCRDSDVLYKLLQEQESKHPAEVAAWRAQQTYSHR